MPVLVEKVYVNANSKPYMQQPFGLKHRQRRSAKNKLPFGNWYNHRFQLLGSGELSVDDILRIACEINQYECFFVGLDVDVNPPRPCESPLIFCRQLVLCIISDRVIVNGHYYYQEYMLPIRFCTLSVARGSATDFKDLSDHFKHFN